VGIRGSVGSEEEEVEGMAEELEDEEEEGRGGKDEGEIARKRAAARRWTRTVPRKGR
jgi:hypothetical protein